MTTLEVGKKLVELCQQGENLQAIQTLYSPEIVSIEAGSPTGGPTEVKGMEAVLGKAKWWSDNHIVHTSSVDGPYPNRDRFIVKFHYNVTSKPMNQVFDMHEMGLYTVADGKVVREEFFYTLG